MDYKKKYRDLVEAVKELQEANPSDEGIQKWVEDNVPQLAKSKDEKIRKYLIILLQHFCKGYRVPGLEFPVSFKDMLSWLEKQGESDETKAKMFLIDKGYPIDANGVFPTYEEMYNIIREGLEQQSEQILANIAKTCKDEQKPNPYSGTSFDYDGHTWGMCARDNGVELLLDGELKAFLSLEKSFIYPIHPQPELAPKSALEAAKEEKVDNANKVEPKDYNDIDPHFGKPIDKVEPKFKVGDWVVNELGDVWHIDSFDKKNYQVSNGNEYNYFPISMQNEMHLWSIADAEDGDVLAAHECLVLFREIDGLNIRCYCTYHFMNNPSFYVDTLQNKDAFHPATKEQRDLLFSKMHEEGYEWDAEKKEPKKIKQKYWSEEDNFMYNKIKNLLTDISLAPESINSLSDWLKDLKDRVQPQTTWKPSREQIMALRWVLNHIPYDSHKEEISGLLEQLNKLREE